MNHNKSGRSALQGSALITVLVLMWVMALVTASMLTYTISERRGNERNRLIQRAKNMSENITSYAAEQLTTKLYRLGSAPQGKFPWTGTDSNRVYVPPDQVLDNPPFTSHTTAEMRAGIMARTPMAFETDITSPNYGLQVSTAKVPIIAKITATHPAVGSFTSYVEQDMALSLTPLFQFGMFYNMDLELYPSQDFTLAGPVHTNNRLMAHPDGGASINIKFTDRVTSAGGLYADAAMKVITRGPSGSATTPTPASGEVYFTDRTTSPAQFSLKNSATNLWRDHKFLTTVETTTTIANFKTDSLNVYHENLRTSAHGVTKLELPGIGSYKEVDDLSTTGVDERSNGREIIEPPNAKKWVWDTTTNTGAWTAHTDLPDAKQTKLSWKCGLYIIANPSDITRSCTLPNGTPAYLLANSYRAFLNTVNSSTDVHTVNEVVLPGQPTYGYNNGADATAGTADDFMYHNFLPNRYNPNTIAGGGTGNAVLRIPQQGTGTGTGYLTNAILILGATTIPVNTGTGTILVGDTLTIISPTTGTNSYLVTSATAGSSVTSVTIAPPGIRSTLASVPTGMAITVAAGTGEAYQTSAGKVVGDTVLAIDTGAGTILPGNIIIIDSLQYLVTAATAGSPVTSVTIAQPGLRANVANNTPITVVAQSGLHGSGTLYQTTAAASFGANALGVDGGTGTILPGDIITIVGGPVAQQYLVTAASIQTGTTYGGNIGIAPNLVAASTVGNNANITGVAETLGTGTGYLINGGSQAIGATSLTVNTGAGTILPGNIITVGVNSYVVTAATSGTPVTSITIPSPGLIAAVATGDLVIVDPFAYSGYARNGGGYGVYPKDSGPAATLYPADAYFFDIRRANSNRGVIGGDIAVTATASYDRGTLPYVPRPVAKIDFDMARFKMMFDRVISSATTSTGYDLRAPNDGVAVWAKSIYNASGASTLSRGLGGSATFNVFPAAGTLSTLTRPDPFQLYYAPANPVDPVIFTNPMSFAVASTVLSDPPNDCAWYDGIAIYLHSLDAEVRKQTIAGTPDRIDSGVRLWNGRGPVSSLPTAGTTGFSFITNDACYIIGHFNADGTINSVETSTTAEGGFSARYPDVTSPLHSEKLCATMGDAITIMSAPTWTNNSSGQVTGWNDAYSALPADNSTSGWRSADPLVGTQDGVYIATGFKPGLLPNSNTPGLVGPDQVTKLDAIDTEVSTALLVGIVPSNASPGYVATVSPTTPAVTDGYVPTWTHAAMGDPLVVGNRVNAGGANNFPRLLDNWQPGGVRKGLYIRGSIVAMFESRVAMEPFSNSRCYVAPGRYWGLHENFRTVNHDLPLEPLVVNSTRAGFRELTPTEYANLKTMIEALPVLP